MDDEIRTRVESGKREMSSDILEWKLERKWNKIFAESREWEYSENVGEDRERERVKWDNKRKWNNKVERESGKEIEK